MSFVHGIQPERVHGTAAGDISLKFGGGYSGYAAQFDYMFYRKRIGEGDPTFIIGAEIAP